MKVAHTSAQKEILKCRHAQIWCMCKMYQTINCIDIDIFLLSFIRISFYDPSTKPPTTWIPSGKKSKHERLGQSFWNLKILPKWIVLQVLFDFKIVHWKWDDDLNLTVQYAKVSQLRPCCWKTLLYLLFTCLVRTPPTIQLYCLLRELLAGSLAKLYIFIYIYIYTVIQKLKKHNHWKN